MKKYVEIEQLKADIKSAYKGKNEFMGEAICNVIDRRAIEPMKSQDICDYCYADRDYCGSCGLSYSGFKGKEMIEVE